MKKSILNAEFYNQMLDKKGTKKILSWFLNNYGPTRTSQFLEELKSVGFHFATQAGISLGFDDLKVPLKKSFILQNAEVDLQRYETRFQQGRMTAVERYQKVIDIWTTASENLKDEVIQNFQNTDLFNPLYMMAFSGARGNISQVRQLVGMRGLMSDSAGGIIDFPIRSNFREGLTVTEYVISCYGARKGLIDTALRTADSGYLTRRLVDVAHGIMIGRIECGTEESFAMYPLKTAGKSGAESIVLSLEKRIQGRILAQDIEKIESSTSADVEPSRFENIHTRTRLRPLLAHKNQEITPLLAAEIAQHQTQLAVLYRPKAERIGIEYGKAEYGVMPFSVLTFVKLETPEPYSTTNSSTKSSVGAAQVKLDSSHSAFGQGPSKLEYESLSIRSPFTCQHFQNAREDICQLCYGWSLAHGRLVSLGEAVGVLAAQSIGEPGTQLTMRTFHTGGIFSTDIDAKIFAPHDGIIHFGAVEGIGGPYAALPQLRPNLSPTPQEYVKLDGTESSMERPGVAPGPTQHRTRGQAPRGKKIRTFHGETAFFLFEPVQCKIEEANSLRVSVFYLPAQSLVFVYPGQKVLKNSLCAEISHLLNARTAASPMNIREANPQVLVSEAVGRTESSMERPGVAPGPTQHRTRDPKVKLDSSPRQQNQKKSSTSENTKSIGLSSLVLDIDSSMERQDKGRGLRPWRFRVAKLLSPTERSSVHRTQQKRDDQSSLREIAWNGPSPMPQEIKLEPHTSEAPTEALESSNTKKVLSEIEGQVYFHRLAERRQTTEFENMTHVKGVGSLWILHGKAVQMNGHLQSGDFYQANSFGIELGSNRNRPSVRPLTYSQGSSFTPAGETAPTSDEVNRGWQIRKANTPISTLTSSSMQESFRKAKSRLTRFRTFQKQTRFSSRTELRSYQQYKINGNLWIPAISFVSYWQDGDICESEAQQVRVSRQNWLQLQKKKPLPEGTLFAFSAVQNRIRQSQKFQNLFGNWRNLGSGGGGGLRQNNEGENANDPTFNYEMVAYSVLTNVKLESAYETKNCKIFRLSFISGNRPRLAVEYADSHGESFALTRVSDSRSESAIHGRSLRALGTELSANKEVRLGMVGGSGHGLRTANHPTSPNEATPVHVLGELRSVQGQRPQRSSRRSPNSFNQKSLLLQKSHLRRLEIHGLGIKYGEAGYGAMPFSRSETPESYSTLNSCPTNNLSEEAYSGGESASSSKMYKKIGEFIRNAESFSLTEVGTHGSGGGDPWLAGTGAGRSPTTLVQGPTLDKTVHIVSRMTNKYAGAHIEFDIDRRSNSIPNYTGSVPGSAIRAERSEDGQFLRKRNSYPAWNLCFTLRRIHPYLISNDSGLAVRHGDIVSARQFLFELFFEKSKTGDIVQGLPKIEQLFEARRTSLHVMETIHLKLKSKFTELCKEYPLYEATRQSIRFIQRVLLDEIQMVYQSQGVDIADKHLEIIIRQMTSKVIIQEKGQSPFFPDDIIDFYQLKGFASSSTFRSTETGTEYGKAGYGVMPFSVLPFVKLETPEPYSTSYSPSNTRLQGANTADESTFGARAISTDQRSYNQETLFEPIVLGITKRSFFTESFVSAASFQEAKRVLMHCALQSKVDFLYGLKENVILGRFIRAGTGFRTSVFPTLS